MKEKLKLAPVSVAWKAGAYGISIEGAEADTFTAATTVTLKDGTEKKLSISFPSFAEVRFFNFNFGEHHYNEYEIKGPDGNFLEDTFDWQQLNHIFQEKGICPNPYFYEVLNTAWFYEKEIYKPLAAKKFKHFLLVGYDSYLEILAVDDVQYSFT